MITRKTLRLLAPILFAFSLGLMIGPATAHEHSKAETPTAHDPAKHHHAMPQPETKTYTCPMHPQVHQDHPGTCQICGMALVAAKPGMRFTTQLDPATPQAGQPFWFSYRFRDPDGSTPDLQEMHTKLSHLIVVSKDLSYFDHVHPEQIEPGKFMIQLTLAAGGEYVLYADATPSGGVSQVERFPIDVGGSPKAAAALEPTPMETSVAGYEIHLAIDPTALKVGEAMLTFQISKDGKPATDLQPYLGAGGHLVIISQDTQQFLHAHPADHEEEAAGGTTSSGDMGGMSMAAGEQSQVHDVEGTAGSTVIFHTAFPVAGRYKAWGQFLTSAGVIVAPFVIDVR